MIVITNQDEFDAFLAGLPVNENGISVISDDVTIAEQADCRLTKNMFVNVSGSLCVKGTIHVDGTIYIYVGGPLNFNFTGTLYVNGEFLVYVGDTVRWSMDSVVQVDGTLKIYGKHSVDEGGEFTVIHAR